VAIWTLHSKFMLMKPASIVASLGKYNMTCPFRPVNRVGGTLLWISDPMRPKHIRFNSSERPPLWLNLDREVKYENDQQFGYRFGHLVRPNVSTLIARISRALGRRVDPWRRTSAAQVAGLPFLFGRATQEGCAQWEGEGREYLSGGKPSESVPSP
jgi:hypothetical protein